MHRILNGSIIIVVFVTFVNALVFFGLGILQSFEVYIGMINGSLAHAGIYLVEALDRFLVGFVFIIFSIGLSQLFLTNMSFLKKYELPWLELTNFYQLKTLLISAILVALFVAWIPYAPIFSMADGNDLGWTDLIFPASMVLMAVAARLIKELH